MEKAQRTKAQFRWVICRFPRSVAIQICAAEWREGG